MISSSMMIVLNAERFLGTGFEDRRAVLMNRVPGGFSPISRPVFIIPALRWSLIVHRDIFVPTRCFCALRVSAVRVRYCAKTIYGVVIETRRRVVCRKGKVDAGLIEIEQLRILPVAGCVVVISAN